MREANIICLIQHFEAGFPKKVSLKILNFGIILKTFTHADDTSRQGELSISVDPDQLASQKLADLDQRS